jgi:hypothetical protein
VFAVAKLLCMVKTAGKVHSPGFTAGGTRGNLVTPPTERARINWRAGARPLLDIILLLFYSMGRWDDFNLFEKNLLLLPPPRVIFDLTQRSV